MNQIKKDLEKELRTVTLSDEKKRHILGKMNRKKRGDWSYRLVLATFTIFMVGFGFLLLQSANDLDEVTGTTKPEERISAVNRAFDSDWWKVILLIGLFIIIRVIVKRSLDKKGKGLPVCIKCGEEWSYREALKMSMKNEAVTCPYCGKKQYKTRKSTGKISTLNFLIPLGILVAQFFNHILLGYFIHSAGAIWLMLVLTPYLMEFQEDDPIVKPLY